MKKKVDRKKLIVFLAIGFCIIIATVLAAVLLTKPQNFTKSDYDKIKIGATLEEVKSIYKNFDKECKYYDKSETLLGGYKVDSAEYLCIVGNESDNKQVVFTFLTGKLEDKYQYGL